MAESRSEYIRCPTAIYCLPSSNGIEPYCGVLPNMEGVQMPTDIPSTLTESMTEEYALRPEAVLTKFLDTNPNFYNPRDIARIIYHTRNISPYANTLILFNSSFSSKALLLSFITAIDHDAISIIDSISYITMKLAIPTNSFALSLLATTFAHIYCMRNPYEWPDKLTVRDIFLSVVAAEFLGMSFSEAFYRFPTSANVNNYVIEQIEKEYEKVRPPLFFTSITAHAPVELTGEMEHEGRFMSSWSSLYYVKSKDRISSYASSSSRSESLTEIPTDFVTASPKYGVKNKAHVMVITRNDNSEFGMKRKDGVMKKSTRKSYTFAFKTESELLTWISSINFEEAKMQIGYVLPQKKDDDD